MGRVSHCVQEYLLLQLTGQGTSSLNQLPSVRRFLAWAWRSSAWGHTVVSGGQWEADGSLTHSMWHIDIWTLKQFCWLRLPIVSLGTLNQTIGPGRVSHSPCFLFHSPRFLCPTLQDHCTHPSLLSASKANISCISTHRAQGESTQKQPDWILASSAGILWHI